MSNFLQWVENRRKLRKIQKYQKGQKCLRSCNRSKKNRITSKIPKGTKNQTRKFVKRVFLLKTGQY